MSSANLQKNILATIAYYDGMDYPMTAFEIWKYLIEISNFQFPISNKIAEGDHNYSLADVVNELDEYSFRKSIEQYRGFYFLRGRKDLVAKRITANKISEAKIKKLRRIVWFLRFVPYIKMIGVTGRLAMKNAGYKSDWDVLVVLKNGRIWIGRTLTTALLHLIGKRRHGRRIKDRICLNYFVTDESLELITQDLYSSGEYFHMFPVFNNEIFQKFQIRNSWIKNYRPNYYLTQAQHPRALNDSKFAKFLRKAGEKIFDWDFLENWLSNWQSRKIMNNPQTHLPGSFIKATNEQLIFLPKPRSNNYFSCLQKKISRLIMS